MKLLIEAGLKDSLKPELARLNESLETLARSTDGFLGDLLPTVLLGSGKRVRPALVFLSAKLGSAPINHVRVVAQAVELIHIATLVHDDIIDKAAMRRGLRTIYKEHGIDTAVLLGDHIYTYAFQTVAELGNANVLKLLAQSTSAMCQGEIDQLKNRYQFDLSEADYFSFIEKKTAALFGVSAQSGAILADQSEEIQNALHTFGLHLGIGFQIIDDLLDLTGDEAVVGKTLRTDLFNGKMTLPMIHYRDHSSSTSEMKKFFLSLDHPNGQIVDFIENLKRSESIQYAEDIAQYHVQEALSQLDQLPSGEPRELLTSLAQMLLRRTS